MSSSSSEECRSPVGLDCCSCCLDLANRSGPEDAAGGNGNPLGSPTVSNFRQLREQLVCENLNADKLSSIMRQDSLEPVVRDPCYLLNQGICNRNIDQTMLSILLFFHRQCL
ncbi:TSC22 domain family protein 3 [Alligator mississippiensis]|uniref:TSC22 domain family protein 3 n=1 Tax=Alligator mississippiensis TaxID=8496 RepID=A0A151P7Q8_ALLMI|nr:TSC22 domain family protein 3 [Alligator mississippiensis]